MKPNVVNKTFGIAALIVFVMSMLGGVSSALAKSSLSFEDAKNVVKDIEVYGDLRLRHEVLDREAPAVDRQRQRIRLRVGLDVTLPHDLAIKTRFASGTGEQTSTNQTLDDNGSQKQFWVDRAYLQWKPKEIFKFQGGKMKNPFWTEYTSDVFWDTDYNPEGLSESVNAQLRGPFRLFANLGQFSIQERGANQKDTYALVSQGGAEMKAGENTKIIAGIGYHDWQNIVGYDLGSVKVPGTNTTDANGRVHSFKILELTGALKGKVANIPWSVAATYAKNNGYNEKLQEATNPGQGKQDDAIQAGVTVGKAKKKKAWELAYYYKQVKADAVVDSLSDSDFGATNRKGHIAWVAYGLTDFMQLKLKNFVTKTIVHTGNPDRKILTQLDLVTKF